MQAIASALADPLVRAVYLVFCVAFLVVPIVVIAIWYRAQIRRTAGGEAVQREQARIGVRTGRDWQAIGFARDIAGGRYGTEVRALLYNVCILIATWALLNAVTFGILIWADEVNRP